MSIFKCKMCGGALEIKDGSTVALCEYCGTNQTLPKLTDEKRANLYDRANHFRRNSEFDKAAAIYEQILFEDNTDAEAYWSLVLCRYGIEYVVDPISQRRVPTIRRAQYTSIFDDANYKSAVKIADNYQRVVYEEEATTINEIQKGILAISQKEDPFDVFLCYKETDESGKRTHDSVLAQELYYELKQEGFKVFFSRITLEDKLGTAYEPYIFAALNSAKVMVVLGSKPEYFNSIWVKNEWSRFLSLIQNGEKKVLIPAYKDMDPYNLPIEFSHLQAQNMSKLAFMQDLVYGIKKILGKDKQEIETDHTNPAPTGQDPGPFLRRAFLFLEDGEFESADEYAEKVLDIYPECAEAYIVKLLIELGMNKPSDLITCQYPLSNSSNYRKAIRFASNEYREIIEGYNRAIKDRIETNRKDELYFYGINLINASRFEEAIQLLKKISSYRDAEQKIEYCEQCIENRENEIIYANAIQCFNSSNYDQAISLFGRIDGYRDSKEKLATCIELKETARKEAIYSRAIKTALSPNATDVTIQNCIEQLYTIRGYKDVDDQIKSLDNLIEEWRKQKEIEEEEARIRAEEERVIRERQLEEKRIKAEKRKKVVKRVALFGIPALILLGMAVLFVSVVLIILFAVVIPTIQYNTANDLLKSDKYDEALEIYESLNGFGESDKYITVIEGINKIDESSFEEGIRDILSAGVTVKITYGLEGGKIPASDTASIYPQNSYLLSVSPNSNTKYFSSKETDTVSDNTFIYESESDFNGLISPQKAGYRFIKWTLDSYEYDVSSDNVFSIKLTAQWNPLEYTIQYDLEGGSLSESNPTEYGTESDVIEIKNPTRTGYTFLGWTGTDTETPTTSLIIAKGSIGDRTYVANWQPNSYTISLDCNGGSLSNYSIKVTFDTEFTLPIPTREGYEFTGWTCNGDDFNDGEWNSTSDISIIANWSAKKYTLTYNDIKKSDDGEEYVYSNGSINSITVEFDTHLELPILSREGYSFLGWYHGETKVESGSWNYDSDLTLTPEWEANQFVITLDPDGGDVSSDTISATYGMPYSLPRPNKTGFVFAGWFDGYVEVKDGTWSELDNVTLKARWIANAYTFSLKDIVPIKSDIQIILDYNYQDGGKSTIKLNDGTKLAYPENPIREGYVFTGWYTSKNCTEIYDFSGNITANMTLYAGWTKHINSTGSNTNIVPTDYSSLNMLKFSTGTTSANAHSSLYFVANESGEHTIYFRNSSTNADNSAYIKIFNLSTNLVIKDNSQCSSTTFAGVTFSCQKGDVIVIEFYKYFLESTVSFYFSGFNYPQSNAIAASETIIGYRYEQGALISENIIYGNDLNLPTPTRDGYNFVGWYTNETQITSGKWTLLNDVTLTPRWEPRQNTITFDANGGTVSESTIKVYYDQLYVLPIPTKTDSTFVGWYLNGVQISNGIWTGNYDLTLTARWTTEKLSVTFEDVSELDNTATIYYNFNYSENGSQKVNSRSYITGQAIPYPDMPIRTGYVFTGWYTESECINKFDFIGSITHDIMLYAGWREMGKMSVHSNIQIIPSSYIGVGNTLTQSTNGTSVSYKKYYYLVAEESGAHSIFYKNSVSASNGAYVLEIKNFTTGEQIFISQSVSNTEFLEQSFICSKGDIIVISIYRKNSSSTTDASFYFEGFTKPSSNATALPPQSGIVYTENAMFIQAVQYGENFILPIPTREGYTFAGWYYGTRKVENGTWNFTSNITLTAKWTPNS